MDSGLRRNDEIQEDEATQSGNRPNDNSRDSERSVMIEYETLRVIWWLILGVLLIGFAVMDGFDLGVAALLRFLARDDDERRALLETMIESARNGGLWTLQAGVFTDNGASLALHRALGFREVGIRERIGRLDGVWRDVVLLELRL